MNGFLMKLILNMIVIIPLLMWFSDASFLVSLVTALALSVLSYLVGDQLLLRITNNRVSTIVDAALAFGFFWIAAWVTNWTLNLTEILTISVLLGSVEWAFHRYLRKVDEPNRIL